MQAVLEINTTDVSSELDCCIMQLARPDMAQKLQALDQQQHAVCCLTIGLCTALLTCGQEERRYVTTD